MCVPCMSSMLPVTALCKTAYSLRTLHYYHNDRYTHLHRCIHAKDLKIWRWPYWRGTDFVPMWGMKPGSTAWPATVSQTSLFHHPRIPGFATSVVNTAENDNNHDYLQFCSATSLCRTQTRLRSTPWRSGGENILSHALLIDITYAIL